VIEAFAYLPTVAWHTAMPSFGQFAVDARRTPQRIGHAHPADQITDLYGLPGRPRRRDRVAAQHDVSVKPARDADRQGRKSGVINLEGDILPIRIALIL
jgi:hypothetical protein